MPKKTVFAAYIPVIHRGYLQYFKAFPEINEIYVFDNEILSMLDYIRKDLRALSPAQQKAVLIGLERFKTVKKLDEKILKKLDKLDVKFVMPDEDISREVSRQIKKAEIELYPIFLRWDRSNVENVDLETKDIISSSAFSRSMMARALRKSKQSPDIWRRVGAVIVTSEKKVIGPIENRAEPSQQTPLIEGDPRNIFNRGVAVEMSLFTHAEAALIAEAARAGQKLEKAEIYVTTFPCPACAKLIARSGIKKCYYYQGYAVLDGKRILDEYSVKIIKVESVPNGEAPDPTTVKYKK